VRTGTLRWLTPRVKAYGVVWALLVAGVSSLIAFRSTIDILILRQAGTAYSEAADGAVANFYNVQIINRSANERVLEYRAVEPAGAIVSMLGPLDHVPAHQIVESRLMLRVPKARLSGNATPVRFEILEHGRVLDEVTSSFLGPGVN
jgi:polyferredoxin